MGSGYRPIADGAMYQLSINICCLRLSCGWDSIVLRAEIGGSTQTCYDFISVIFAQSQWVTFSNIMPVFHI